jgi:WD40 repeat protein
MYPHQKLTGFISLFTPIPVSVLSVLFVSVVCTQPSFTSCTPSLCPATQVWDLAQQKCEHTLTHHTDKVQSVAWNPAEAAVMLTGGFDKTAHLLDVRSPGSTVRVALTADTECVAWDLATPQCFLVATEDGLVACHDARKLGQSGDAKASAVYTLAAHDKATCAMSFCPAAPQVRERERERERGRERERERATLLTREVGSSPGSRRAIRMHAEEPHRSRLDSG